PPPHPAPPTPPTPPAPPDTRPLAAPSHACRAFPVAPQAVQLTVVLPKPPGVPRDASRLVALARCRRPARGAERSELEAHGRVDRHRAGKRLLQQRPREQQRRATVCGLASGGGRRRRCDPADAARHLRDGARGAGQGLFATQPDSAARSRRPYLQSRVRLGWGPTDDPNEIAIGGHQGWLASGDSLFQSQAVTVDTRVKLGVVELIGEGFVGKALAGLGGGGIGQSLGPPPLGVPVRTKGGWGQLNIRL